ncbi:hypothetical protein NC652_039675 [Populus alba x Populus x berolinensis]|nr:hypothetical protein NC652_039675 [Populus alba x Populus x berolinensis]
MTLTQNPTLLGPNFEPTQTLFGSEHGKTQPLTPLGPDMEGPTHTLLGLNTKGTKPHWVQSPDLAPKHFRSGHGRTQIQTPLGLDMDPALLGPRFGQLPHPNPFRVRTRKDPNLFGL